MTKDNEAAAGKPAAGKPAPAPAPAPAAGKPAPAAGAVAGAAGKPAAGKPVPAAGTAPVTAPAPGKGKPAAGKPAPAASKEEPGGPDFTRLKTVEELVEAYNDMVPTAIDLAIPKINTTRSFADEKTGRLACERLHALIMKARDPSNAEKKETAVRKTRTAKKAASKKSAKSSARKPVRAARTSVKYPDDAKITVLKKDNPYREGSGRHKRAAKVLSSGGKTVGAFRDGGGKLTTLANMVRSKLVRVG